MKGAGTRKNNGAKRKQKLQRKEDKSWAIIADAACDEFDWCKFSQTQTAVFDFRFLKVVRKGRKCGWNVWKERDEVVRQIYCHERSSLAKGVIIQAKIELVEKRSCQISIQELSLLMINF